MYVTAKGVCVRAGMSQVQLSFESYAFDHSNTCVVDILRSGFPVWKAADMIVQRCRLLRLLAESSLP